LRPVVAVVRVLELAAQAVLAVALDLAAVAQAVAHKDKMAGLEVLWEVAWEVLQVLRLQGLVLEVLAEAEPATLLAALLLLEQMAMGRLQMEPAVQEEAPLVWEALVQIAVSIPQAAAEAVRVVARLVREQQEAATAVAAATVCQVIVAQAETSQAAEAQVLYICQGP
jgi:hypothetical protein